MTIIDSRLIKDLLGKRHRLSLEFNQHKRLHQLVIHNGIATLLEPSHLNRNLYAYQSVRILILGFQDVQNGLSNIFLRREANILTPPRTENLLFTRCTHVTSASCL